MNRKSTVKTANAIAKREKEAMALRQLKINALHPFDDPLNWIRDDFQKPPMTAEEVKRFQAKLDSAFEVKNGIVLAWGADRRYGDIFLNEKNEPERKPPLLFAEYKVNERDYIYVSAPRWLLLETIHGSQLEAGWDEASKVTNEHGIEVRIRPDKPPKFMYRHFKIIAEHEQTILINDMPPCCLRMMSQNRVCYGKYRKPDDRDIALVGRTRKRMNDAGAFQRNDEARSKKILMDGALSTKHFIQRAKEQQAQRVKDIMLNNSEAFFGDLLEKTGSTKTFKELEQIAKGALDRQDEQRGLR